MLCNSEWQGSLWVCLLYSGIQQAALSCIIHCSMKNKVRLETLVVSESWFAFMCAAETSRGLPKSWGWGAENREEYRAAKKRLNKEIRTQGHAGEELLHLTQAAGSTCRLVVRRKLVKFHTSNTLSSAGRVSCKQFLEQISASFSSRFSTTLILKVGVNL